MIAGPGILTVEIVALFLHLFTSVQVKPVIVAGLVIFFVVFIPLYSVEYFRQQFKKEEKRKIRFGKRKTRSEWEGGNIHGKVPTETERPGKIFRK